MAIGNITDGEDGGDVRVKLNLSIDQLNLYTGGQATFTGAGATNSTKTAIFENSSSVTSLTILDDGSVYNLGGGNVATNVAYGVQALVTNTTGAGNTGIGYLSLFTNNGSDNTGVGRSALYFNETGNNNTGLGRQVLYRNTTGSNNTGSGYQSLIDNTIGDNNSGFGFHSLANNTEGNNNTGIGKHAGFTNLTGSDNVFLGANSGYYETTGSKLFIDNAQRASEADGRVKSLVYGEFAASVADQRLSVNGSVGIAGAATSTSTLNVSGLPTSSAGLVSGDVWSNSGVLTIV
jgi:hypothetical protein